MRAAGIIEWDSEPGKSNRYRFLVDAKNHKNPSTTLTPPVYDVDTPCLPRRHPPVYDVDPNLEGTSSELLSNSREAATSEELAAASQATIDSVANTAPSMPSPTAPAGAAANIRKHTNLQTSVTELSSNPLPLSPSWADEAWIDAHRGEHTREQMLLLLTRYAEKGVTEQARVERWLTTENWKWCNDSRARSARLNPEDVCRTHADVLRSMPPVGSRNPKTIDRGVEGWIKNNIPGNYDAGEVYQCAVLQELLKEYGTPSGFSGFAGVNGCDIGEDGTVRLRNRPEAA